MTRIRQFMSIVSRLHPRVYDVPMPRITVTQAGNYPPPQPTEAYPDRINNLVSILEGYFAKGGHHLNVNILSREKLIDAMNNPDKNPGLTVRVSGYAVHFNRLTKEQQQDVVSRTFHQDF